ncbi:hypothetical protein BGZ96_003921 [Linnemannia gamsii]|uniref:HCP-like protein n=1 Tax=Linnemannia gamsii TaxID=64522 RepID=A0ABQ7KHN2_9FUNG|nr:hypothetical protein BGZ96_003921 [Linnemannia gamsii]
MSREENDTRRRVQTLRPVYNTSTPATPAALTDLNVFHLAVHSGDAREDIFYWEDIVFAFKDALNIRHGADILSFVRGRTGRGTLEPLCFTAMPDVVLDVYIELPLMQMNRIIATLQALHAAPTARPPSNMRASSSAPRTTSHSIFRLALRPVPRRHLRQHPSRHYSHHLHHHFHQHQGQEKRHHHLNSHRQRPRQGKASNPNRKTTVVDVEEEPSVVIVQSQTPSAAVSSTTNNAKASNSSQPRVSKSTNAKPSDSTPPQHGRHLPAKEKTKTGSDTLLRAKTGDVHAQVTLAEAFRDGSNGYQQSYLEAIFWFLRAAEQEDATAQYNIGLLYELGQGIQKDSSMAAFWYDNAAHQGLAKAQSNLGILYINGEGVEKDKALAMQWLIKAASQGNASTQFNLGCM